VMLGNKPDRKAYGYLCLGPTTQPRDTSSGRRLSVEGIRCPNPKCGRHILDIEEMPPGRTVLEILQYI